MVEVEDETGDVCNHCYGCACDEYGLEVLRTNVGNESAKVSSFLCRFYVCNQMRTLSSVCLLQICNAAGQR